jgi:hypothetical protein
MFREFYGAGKERAAFRFVNRLNMRGETPRELARDDLNVPFDHLDHHEVGGPRSMQVQGSHFIARADASDPTQNRPDAK